jgi:acyl-CoA synthetase (AMP-forming)/AMP-acid ligase II
MIFRSPYPDVDIPDSPLTPFALRHADRLGDRPALIDAASDQCLSYAALSDAVRRVAAGLAQRGLQKGDVLANFASNCTGYVVAFLAASSLGAITTPVNHLVTAEELARQLADSDSRFLLTTPNLLSVARMATAHHPVQETFVLGDGDASPFADLYQSEPGVADQAIDPAHDVIALPYSSGTTGLPKGVMLTHRNIVGNVCQINVPQQMQEAEVVFCLPPFSHQYGLFLIAWTLSVGATLVFAPRFELATFLGAVERHRVTRAYVAPPVVLALANDPSVDRTDLSSLRVMTSGAAPLSADLMRRCGERLGCTVIQASGLTETSPATHSQSPSDPRLLLGSIGPCLPNTECKVVDVDTGAELGPDHLGEIWLRGPQVMKGYLNRPEATAAMIDSDGWLHTGDLGCADAAGNFFIVDRLKEMIKYKGYQIAPAELEAVLLSHPAVVDAAVIPIPDEGAGELPKAFVVLKEDSTAEDIMTFVAARVAPYKKVRRLEFIDQIPKSASGKILRRVLVERERAAVAVPVLV